MLFLGPEQQLSEKMSMQHTKAAWRKTRKPTGYAALVKWVQDNYPSAMREHIEADDLMAIIQSNPDNAGKTIIVSDDKDLLSCPGKALQTDTR